MNGWALRRDLRAFPAAIDADGPVAHRGTHLAAVADVRPSSVPYAPLLLTVPDTARRLHRHEQTVRAMIRRGDLAAVRLGRLVRVLAAAVDGFGDTGMATPPVVGRGVRRGTPRLAARTRT